MRKEKSEPGRKGIKGYIFLKPLIMPWGKVRAVERGSDEACEDEIVYIIMRNPKTEKGAGKMASW